MIGPIGVSDETKARLREVFMPTYSVRFRTKDALTGMEVLEMIALHMSKAEAQDLSEKINAKFRELNVSGVQAEMLGPHAPRPECEFCGVEDYALDSDGEPIRVTVYPGRADENGQAEPVHACSDCANKREYGMKAHKSTCPGCGEQYLKTRYHGGVCDDCEGRAENEWYERRT